MIRKMTYIVENLLQTFMKNSSLTALNSSNNADLTAALCVFPWVFWLHRFDIKLKKKTMSKS